MNYREMTIDDFEKVHALWMSIHGFGIRSIDDSREGVEAFLNRNPGFSVVAEEGGQIVGSILCGHDGRTACFYHVCVREDKRRQGIGKDMTVWCMRKLNQAHVNKISLVAFKDNSIGNSFWQQEGWKEREDYNVYDFYLNEKNITEFNR
ncbi:GNAT family N-acetyltransferase [Candidatus Weimeria sp. HCP3S3_B5]|uniref:GNAT family N-acetyltransferase n=1 Tax=Candidatus Weimeria sp. HCP3S3_B5 TaxID=3438871 RepID=UPI002AA0964B|nr:GNAT family N-acetyltransferase [Lachnospiraceae bacterium]